MGGYTLPPYGGVTVGIVKSRRRSLPLLPLRGVLVFPFMVIHLDVGREKSIAALDEAMVADKEILLVSQEDAQMDEPSPEEIYSVGTIVEIKQLLKLPGGAVRVLVEGISRARIEEYTAVEPFYQVIATEFAEKEEQSTEIEAMTRNLVFQFEQYVKLSKKIPAETVVSIITIEDAGRLTDLIASHLTLKLADKQRILEAIEIRDRLVTINSILAKEIEILELERKINVRVRKQMEKTQKEYYLREQLRAIQRELGEREESGEGLEYRERIDEIDLPEEVKKKALKEVERLEKMPGMAAEASIVRTYLDWLLELPWKVQTKDRLNLEEAQKILDEDHYGLKKVKERILEYLAVRQLAQKLKGPILCFVGPPGVGKTSLAKSVARALKRKYVRISLGGVRDEAEIRGHRRTYVGALPGRIIQGMRQAGSQNPVFLLDEIDKMSMDFRGDPSAALLEVLDPEQNHVFSDHYVEVPFDLSHVFFITTANTTHPIPPALLDRMEVIHLPGYTEEEKVKIALRYLLPKQRKEHGLDNNKRLTLSENAVKRVIREYTREAGVRNLERSLAAICRKAAREIVQRDKKRVRVTPRNLRRYLGIPRFRYGIAGQEDEVGLATGLAWTKVGGNILSIEVSVVPGKGKLTLTGQLGDVMRESAQAGFSYIRSRADVFQIPADFPEKMDTHIHIPEGAISKDGPSAGITMATALVSALTQRATRADVAMTGEITLRGRILPVGGVKEKILAAHRAGIKKVLLPVENKRDLEEIPANVKRDLRFIMVEHMDQVLKEALVGMDDEDK
ncbi:MAG: endopeptidase La [Firmicutes bacterium]|nr:endopeptidase La [Bacillota bacterium]